MNTNRTHSVCVVVPILNEARYLRESMDSLLSQDYRPLEIIVYDGGSTDGTLDILREYPVEVNVEPGLGQMAAINKGWSRTSAEFVAWWAGDDRYKPGAISRLANELAAHPEAGVVHADADQIDGDGNLLQHLRPGDIQFRELVRDFQLVPQSSLIRRSALAASGMMDEKRRLAADWDLFLRLAQYHRFHYVPFVASERRMHPGSEDVQDLTKQGAACIDVVDKFFERSDLSESQRQSYRFGVAGSRLRAGWCYCAVGDRGMGAKMLLTALQAAPSVFFATPSGPRLLARLLVPDSGINSLKRFLNRLR